MGLVSLRVSDCSRSFSIDSGSYWVDCEPACSLSKPHFPPHNHTRGFQAFFEWWFFIFGLTFLDPDSLEQELLVQYKEEEKVAGIENLNF